MSATAPQSAISGGNEIFVTGMTCSGCATAVSRALSGVEGVTHVEVDLETGRARAAGSASKASLIAAVEKAGFGVGSAEEHGHGHGGHCCNRHKAEAHSAAAN